MLLGKRPGSPVMRRTTSMSGGMALDMQEGSNNLEPHEEVMMSDSIHLKGEEDSIKDPPHAAEMGLDHGLVLVAHQTNVMSPSPTTTNINHSQNHTCNPPQIIHTPHFLRTCSLCKCRLAPGRDIYMYRGDTAFCSLECREKQMKQDQRKEKWKMVASNKEEHGASPPAATAIATAKASNKSETAACT